jgi:hypothetical protein
LGPAAPAAERGKPLAFRGRLNVMHLSCLHRKVPGGVRHARFDPKPTRGDMTPREFLEAVVRFDVAEFRDEYGDIRGAPTMR